MNGNENIKENKMGTMPVRRLLVTMSLPMMASMLMQALYNVVDSVFVSNLPYGEDALTAISMAFPMQNIMIAIASGTAVGVNALLSKSLGEKNHERANEAANAGVLLSVLSSVVMFIAGMLISRPFMMTQTSNPEIVNMGSNYLHIVCCLSAGLFMQVMLERLLQSTGRTVFSMASQLTGAIVNIILDPILIFGYLGMPKLGVIGAAYATVIGQFCAAAVGIVLNIKKNPEIKLSLASILKPSGTAVKRIYAVGVPSILMMSIGSLMTYLMNLILASLSETAVAVFGVYFKLQSFFFMPIFGLNNGLIPIIAYNYGAKNKKRITDTLKFALVLALAVMIVGTLLFNFIPQVLLGFFNASDDMMAIGVNALKTISLCFPIAAVCIALISTFQAFSKSVYSLIISIIRQLGVLIPSAWLLSMTGDVGNVWWSFVIAETAGLMVTLFFFKRIYDRTISTL